jgi:pectinesterase
MIRCCSRLQLWFLLLACAAAQERTTLTVDAHGAGTFRSVSEAVLHADGITGPVTVLVRNGTYREKIFLTRSNIALVGEHRDSTRIVFAELRSNWTRARDNRPDGSADELDWGAGVINIGKGATDVTIANLTVHNNYGSLYGSRDHQFAIRGFDATRVALLYCNIVSDGGDAVALWNRENGMYYHSNCSFEGWVDYMCPRGWCFITDSKFFGHNMSASIWHDGSTNRDQKLVIRSSTFDGVPGFPLGRHHRDAQIYLLDCTFAEALADRPIYLPVSPNATTWVWGERHYFHNSRREAGLYPWLADNLPEAEGSPVQGEITAQWTFGGRWDPERTLPQVLPFASIPTPRNNGYDIQPKSVTLSWIGGRHAIEYKLYAGGSANPPYIGTIRSNSYTLDRLLASTLYYWRVDVVADDRTIPGEVWKFTTSE